MTREHTVFARHLLKIMLAHHLPVCPVVVEYMNALGDRPHTDTRLWVRLRADFATGIRDNCRANPALCAEILTKVILDYPQGAAEYLYDFLYALCDPDDLFFLSCYTVKEDDTRYAITVFLLTGQHSVRLLETYSEAVTNLSGTTVALSDELDTWQQEMTFALFGPAWQLLYGSTFLSGEVIYQEILVARPPFANLERAPLTTSHCLPGAMIV